MRPRWVDEFDIRPDAEAGRVQGDRAMLAHLQETIVNSALARMIDHKPDEPLTLTELVKALEKVRCHKAKDCWHEFRALEVVLDEVTESEFNGEDVLKPKLRELFEDSRRRLEKLATVLERYEADFEFDEPAEETMEDIRQLIEKAAGGNGTNETESSVKVEAFC